MADTADLKTVKFKWPAICRVITQGYGNKKAIYAKGYHTGIDIACAPGSPIYAAHDGTITFAGFNGSYGNEVRVALNNRFLTSYHHMSQIKARKGQGVSAGTIIGYMGSTGMSTGPHLHFEVRINGTDSDPKPYLDGVLSPGGGGVVQAGSNPLVPDWAEGVSDVFSWLADTKNWYRIGLVISGALLILITLIGMGKAKALGKAGMKAVSNSAKT